MRTMTGGSSNRTCLSKRVNELACPPVHYDDRRAFSYPDDQSKPAINADDIVYAEPERKLQRSLYKAEELGLFANLFHAGPQRLSKERTSSEDKCSGCMPGSLNR